MPRHSFPTIALLASLCAVLAGCASKPMVSETGRIIRGESVPTSGRIATLALCGCGRLQDDFRGDTDGGRMQLDIERVENASLDEVTHLRLRAIRPGEARISLTALPLDAAGRPTWGEPVVDTVSITVH
jgi:hypothetical protein